MLYATSKESRRLAILVAKTVQSLATKGQEEPGGGARLDCEPLRAYHLLYHPISAVWARARISERHALDASADSSQGWSDGVQYLSAIHDPIRQPEEFVTDLTPVDTKALGRAVDIDLQEPYLSEVTEMLNAIIEAVDEIDYPGLESVEPLPIILPGEEA